MGRLKRRSKTYQRRKARKELGKRPEAPASDPESCGPSLLKGEEQYSSCANSCDETLSLCTGSPHTSYGVEQPSRLHRIPADEMEVTHRLSCLNFSGTVVPIPGPMIPSLGFEVGSDVEVCSELASATQLDLLPTLSDRGEGTEALDSHYRQARKRPARRKTNRRSKKFRCINSRDTSFVKACGNSLAMATPQQLVRTSSKEAPIYGDEGMAWPGDGSEILLTRSLRRNKRSQQRNQDVDSLCCLSDTSVALDLDTPTFFYTGHNMEGMETTPPAMDLAQMCEDTIPIESELSSTSDSGCEGDDEESSVEGPANATPLLSRSVYPPDVLGGGRWENQVHCPEDSRFQQLLAGSLPLLTTSGRQQVQQVCDSLQEFKHPGRFSVCGRSGGRKKRSKPGELVCPLTLKDISQKILAFVCDVSTDVTELKFNFVSRAFCKTIAALAQVYQLECVIEQKRRLPVVSPRLRKTVYTRLATLHEVEPILRQHGREHVALSPLISNIQSRTSNSCATPSTPLSTTGVRSKTNSSHLLAHATPHSLVVGAGYQPLDETNVGNRMLQSMGWRPGAGLGAESEGIKSPVKAYFRSKHMAGLGFVN